MAVVRPELSSRPKAAAALPAPEEISRATISPIQELWEAVNASRYKPASKVPGDADLPPVNPLGTV
jgi:hypothetical protein